MLFTFVSQKRIICYRLSYCSYISKRITRTRRYLEEYLSMDVMQIINAHTILFPVIVYTRYSIIFIYQVPGIHVKIISTRYKRTFSTPPSSDERFIFRSGSIRADVPTFTGGSHTSATTPAARAVEQAAVQALPGCGRGKRARWRKKQTERSASSREKGREAQRALVFPLLRRHDFAFHTGTSTPGVLRTTQTASVVVMWKLRTAQGVYSRPHVAGCRTWRRHKALLSAAIINSSQSTCEHNSLPRLVQDRMYQVYLWIRARSYVPGIPLDTEYHVTRSAGSPAVRIHTRYQVRMYYQVPVQDSSQVSRRHPR